MSDLESEICNAFCVAVVANGMRIHYEDADSNPVYQRFSEQHSGPATADSVTQWVKRAREDGARVLILHKELQVVDSDGPFPRWSVRVMPISALRVATYSVVVPAHDVPGWVCPPGVTHIRIECVPGGGGGSGGGT